MAALFCRRKPISVAHVSEMNLKLPEANWRETRPRTTSHNINHTIHSAIRPAVTPRACLVQHFYSARRRDLLFSERFIQLIFFPEIDFFNGKLARKKINLFAREINFQRKINFALKSIFGEIAANVEGSKFPI